MFNYFTSGHGPMQGLVRGGLAAAAVAASLAFAAPAAASVFVSTATPLDMWQVGSTVEFDPSHVYETMSPFFIEANDDGLDFTALAFCIDYNNSMEGTWSNNDTLLTVNHEYTHNGTLDLSDEDVAKVVDLVSYGTKLWKFHALTPTVQTHLAAIQGAIWQITTGKEFTFLQFGPSDPSNNYLIQKYADLDGVRHLTNSDVKMIFSKESGAQSLAYELRTAVPEPMSWALMITGFFGAGSALRLVRRRALAAV